VRLATSSDQPESVKKIMMEAVTHQCTFLLSLCLLLMPRGVGDVSGEQQLLSSLSMPKSNKSDWLTLHCSVSATELLRKDD
jgi:hypothetical protein